MDLKMEVYTPELELVGLLEIQNSIIWERKAFTNGSFSLSSLITEESRTLLREENILWIEGDTAGILEHFDQQAGDDGPYITVKGRDLTSILDRRILWGQYDLSGTAPEIMRFLVDDCCIHPTWGDTGTRKIPGLVLSEDIPEGGPVIRVQKTGGGLLDALEELGETYGAAFGVRFNPEVPRLEFWARYGVDRSIHQDGAGPVFYSTELDDVLSSEYSYDSSNYRNIALVAGEGEGAERTQITVSQFAASGLARRELYIDARDLQSDSDPDKPLTPTEYASVLTARGLEKLAEHQLVSSFSVTVRTLDPTYILDVDFFLGDTITVTDERLGVTAEAVVQGAERYVSGDGEGLSLTLGYGQPTLYDILKRKAGK